LHRRITGDCLQVLPKLLDEGLTVDGIIVDTPYPELEKHRKIGTTTRLKKTWFPTMTWGEIYLAFYHTVPLLKKGGSIYSFINTSGYTKMENALTASDYIPRNMLIWDKDQMGMGYHWRNSFEPIVFASKGKAKMTPYVRKHKNILRAKPVKNLDFPTAKPPRLYEQIIRAIIDIDKEETGTILDFSAGTDPLCRAARRLDIDSISIDIKYPDTAYKLNKEDTQETL